MQPGQGFADRGGGDRGGLREWTTTLSLAPKEGVMPVDLTDDEPSKWLPLALDDIDPRDGTGIPFKLVARRFKSSSVACDEFIHDPLSVLIAAQGAGEIFQEVAALTADWKVTTHIVNHHRTLRARHLYALVSANDSESTVGIQLMKLEA
jgi:hypothetical protein